MNIAQCRMARAALKWSLDDLAEAAGVSRRTVAKFEAGAAAGVVTPELVEQMRAAFVAKGIAFTNGGKRCGVSCIRPD